MTLNVLSPEARQMLDLIADNAQSANLANLARIVQTLAEQNMQIIQLIQEVGKPLGITVTLTPQDQTRSSRFE